MSRLKETYNKDLSHLIDNKVILLGISARFSGKRSGKDTVADHALSYINGMKVGGLVATKRSLAEALKRACKEIFLLTDEQLYGTDEQKESLTDWDWPDNTLGRTGKMTAREIQQFFGTEIMRDKWLQNIWIRNVQIWCQQEQQKNPSAILLAFVPDVRYQNEADAMNLLADVYNPIAGEKNTDVHISEIAARQIPDSQYDYLIQNDSSREDLLETSKELATALIRLLSPAGVGSI